jgi:hypothetical protein
MAEGFSNADELIAEVARRYLEIRSYRDQGVVATRFVRGPNSSVPEMTTRKPFRTLFVRPESCRFEFKVEPGRWVSTPESAWQRSVTWSLGGLTRSWWTLHPHVREHPSLFNALGANAGISGGSSMRIPSLLMPGAEARSPLSPSPTRILAGFDAIEDVVCHRLEDQTAPTRRTTVWIDAETFLVRKVFEAIRFTQELQAKLHADSRAAIAAAPIGGLVTAEMKRRIAEEGPKIHDEHVSETTTSYRPVVNGIIERAEFEADLPAD